MIYRGPGFLAVPSPAPCYPPPVSKLSLFLSLLLTCCVSPVELPGGGGGAKPFDGEKDWSSINHSIQSEEIGERWLNSFKISRSPSENYTCHRVCQWSGGDRCQKYIFLVCTTAHNYVLGFCTRQYITNHTGHQI
jgi:hypothetical protein